VNRPDWVLWLKLGDFSGDFSKGIRHKVHSLLNTKAGDAGVIVSHNDASTRHFQAII
jgi:hypothetical protein